MWASGSEVITRNDHGAAQHSAGTLTFFGIFVRRTKVSRNKFDVTPGKSNKTQ
jgi:hypothetical protein